MKRRTFLIAALLSEVLAAGTAGAHAFLERASPPVGGTVRGSPGEVRLWFTEPLEPRFSRAGLSTQSGERIGGRAIVDARDRTQLVLHVPILRPGVYRVNWRVVSVDTHTTEGSFSFEVR